MNLTNEERIAIAKDTGAFVYSANTSAGYSEGDMMFTARQFNITCAAIEAEVERRVREEIENDLKPHLEPVLRSESEPVLWVDVNDLERLKQKDTPVRCLHSRYDADYSPLYLHPQVPEGKVLVPIEPTHSMTISGCNVALGEPDNEFIQSYEEVNAIYKAMLLASQTKGD